MRPPRGRWPVAALLLGGTVVPEQQVRRRILASWRRGCRLLDFTEGRLLVFEAPRMLRVEHLPGEPLLESESRLLSRPLAAEEARAFAGGTLVLRRAGAWQVRPLAEGRPEDPADWLDWSGALRLEGKSLSGLPAALPPALQKPVSTLRQALQVGSPAPEGEAVARHLAGERNWLEQAAGGLTRLVSRSSGAASSRGPVAQVVAPAAHRLAQLAAKLGVWHLLGFRHVAYLHRLFDSLDRLDVEDALRRAIPLGGGDGIAGGVPPLLPPGPRRELQVTARAGGGGIAFGGDVFAQLQERYRRMAEMLESRGEIVKAAFVWAELLNAPQRAIGLLEKEGFFAEAAEIAEIRDLEPAIAARLHFLGGNFQRAIDMAVAFDVFPPVVQALEGSGRREPATSLRRIWAARLLQAGDPAAAVRALWPVATAREEIVPWIEQALATARGSGRAELLILLLQAVPARVSEVLAEWRLLLQPGDRARRRELAELVAAASEERALAPLARATWRALVQDGDSEVLRRLSPRLASRSADPALGEEMRRRALPPAAPPAAAAAALHWEISAPGGGVPISDLLVLGENRLLLAAGANGIFLLGPDGRVEQHFGEPASQLIGADRGGAAIAVFRGEGDYARLARVDLGRRSASRWMEGELEAVAPDFDGQRLAVARGGAFEILDAIDPGGRVLWRMPNLGGRIAAIARDGQHLFFFTEDPLRVWQLDRGWVLRAKDDVELLPEFAQLGTGPYACGLGAGGLCAVAGREDNVWLFRGEREVGQVPLDFCESWSLQGSRLVSVLDIQGNTPCRVTVRSLDDPASPRELARIEGWDSCGLQARVFGRLLAVFDVDGRYLLADLEAGEVRVEGRFCG